MRSTIVLSSKGSNFHTLATVKTNLILAWVRNSYLTRVFTKAATYSSLSSRVIACLLILEVHTHGSYMYSLFCQSEEVMSSIPPCVLLTICLKAGILDTLAGEWLQRETVSEWS